MWNESNASWPGGFNAGPPYDAARMREWVDAHDALARLVARDGEAVVGYCDLAYEGEDAVFIPLLNVHPGYRGQGVGRDLLRRALAEALTIPECRRIHLRTWPANVAAVPLYKKAGFFWEPGTAVSMVSYLPEVMRHPLAAGFFACHDWYRALRRELALAEDGGCWRGLPAFTYQFEANGDRLEVVVDRTIQRITAIERGELVVQGWRGRACASPGSSVPFTVAVTAKPGVPLKVAVAPSPGVALRTPLPTDMVSDGTPALFQGELQLPREDEHGGTEPRLSGAQVVVTAAGSVAPIDIVVPVVAPVRLEYSGARVLKPGMAQDLRFRAANQLDEPLAIRVAGRTGGVLTLADAASGAPFPASIDLAPRAAVSFDVPVAVGRGGTGELVLDCAVTTVSARSRLTFPLQVLAPEPGAVVAAAQSSSCWLANDFVALEGTAGALIVRDRLAGRDALRVSAVTIGPPFRDSEPVAQRTRPAGETGVREVEMHCGYGNGVTLIRRVGLTGPVVTIHDTLICPGDLRPTAPLARITARSLLRGGRIAVPLAEGITIGEVVAGEYPLGQDYRDSADLVREGWLAAWDGLGAAGLVTTGQPSLVFWSRYLAQMTYQLQRLGPGESVELPALRIYAGPGDWRAVRALWSLGTTDTTRPVATPASVAGATLWPRPALVGDTGLTLTIENRRDTPVAGRVSLSLPDGWTAAPTPISANNLTRACPRAVPVTIKQDCGTGHSPAPGAAAAQIVWEGENGRTIQRQPVFCLEAPGSVVIRSQLGGEWLIDNGRLRARVATQPVCCLYSLSDDGRDLLSASYPTAGGFADIAPWHGGLHPQVSYSRDDWPGRGLAERWRAEGVTVHGCRGFCWRGVRLTACAARGGVELSLDLLTLPASNVLAVVARMTNRSTADEEISFGFDAYPLRRSGSPIRYLADAGTPLERERARTDAGSGHATVYDLSWVTAGAPSLVVVSPNALIRLDDYGATGMLLSTVAPWSVAARDSGARVSFVVAAGDAETADLYRDFAGLKGLP